MFIVFSLPRSRSCWLAYALSYKGRLVGHDTVIECDSLGDFTSQFNPPGALLGCCETGAIVGWREIRRRLPQAQFLAIRRQPAAVYQSLVNCGILADPAELALRQEMLDNMVEELAAPVFDFEEISQPWVGEWMFENLLGIPFDEGWWEQTCCLNVQVNMGDRLDRLEARRPALANLRSSIERAGPWPNLN
jgi:hypothetical protein